MTIVHLEADVPNDLLQSFLQTIRTWESQHQQVQIAVKIIGSDLRTREVEAIFNAMDPPFPYMVTVPFPQQKS